MSFDVVVLQATKYSVQIAAGKNLSAEGSEQFSGKSWEFSTYKPLQYDSDATITSYDIDTCMQSA